MPVVSTGRVTGPAVGALPSWPASSAPHDHTVPSDFSAMAKVVPVAIWVTPDNPGTCAGVAEKVLRRRCRDPNPKRCRRT